MEFMVAVINNFGGFYSREVYFQQLRKLGATVVPPCVNNSDYLTDIKYGIAYVGFIHIQSLEKKSAYTIVEERLQNGPYLHLRDFIERTDIPMEQLNILIRVGALGFTGKNKKQLLWEGNFLRKAQHHVAAKESLFNESPLDFSLPILEQTVLEDLYQQTEILQFTLTNVFEMAADDPALFVAAKQIPENLGKEIACLGYLVCIKDTETKKDRKRMHFGTFIDADGDWIDTVHFSASAKLYPFKGRGFYKLYGTVIEEFGVYSVNVTAMHKAGYKKNEY